jgi:co-chaperonin GroES (HSP10)
MNIEPLRNFVLVELRAESAPPASGIEIVRLQQTPSRYARVLAVGPDTRETAVGTTVIISKLQGYEVGGKLVLPESAILATVPE